MQSNNRNLTESAYLDLWSEFHNKALSVYDDVVGDSNSDMIVWSSGLTEPKIIEKHLDKKRYTIEVWQGNTISVDLANLGYKVIVAVEDVYYLDHGLRPSTTYHTWKIIYNNKLPMVNNSNLILGAEVIYNSILNTQCINKIHFYRPVCFLNSLTISVWILKFGQGLLL